MDKTKLEQFKELVESLKQERAEHVAKIAEIDEMLGEVNISKQTKAKQPGLNKTPNVEQPIHPLTIRKWTKNGTTKEKLMSDLQSEKPELDKVALEAVIEHYLITNKIEKINDVITWKQSINRIS